MSDIIEKTIELRAPLDRVWRALTDAHQFSQWFGVQLDGPFEPGKLTRGHITTAGYEHLVMEVRTEAMQPQTLFSFRWHPYAVDASVDYSDETPTLVEFRLAPTAEGVRLKVTETGFEHLPAHRRLDAFRMNERGWNQQMENIKAHLDA